MTGPEYVISLDGRNGIIKGPRSHVFFDVSRGLPGRRKWQKDFLVFEPTRANIEYLKRSPMKIVWDNTIIGRIKEVESINHVEQALTNPRNIPLPAMEWDFKTKPFSHQAQAFAVGKDRDYYGLFFEMGLGKTKVALDIAAYKYAMGHIDTAIVIAPNGVHLQWVEEQIPTHMPDFVKCKAAAFTSYMRKAELEHWNATTQYRGGLRFLAFNIEVLQSKKGFQLVQRLAATGRTLIIIDESTRIKDKGSERTKNALKLVPFSKSRIIMSGAPVTEGLQDMFTQLNFLSEDIHGYSSYYTFQEHFCTLGGFKGKEVVGYRNVDELVTRMSSHSFRVTKAECLDLPEKMYVEKPVDLTSDQKAAYTSMRQQSFALMQDGSMVAVESAMVRILKLQQIVSGFLNDVDPDDPSKIIQHEFPTHRPAICADLVQEAQGSVIVWGRFHYDMKKLSEEFTKRKISFAEYSGRLDDQTNDNNLRRFKSGEVKVMLGTARKGGTGLNLAHASTMIYYSNDFSADTRWQSEDRIHRIGQKGTCTYIDMVAKGTVDKHILAALRKKQSVAKMSIGAIKSFLSE